MFSSVETVAHRHPQRVLFPPTAAVTQLPPLVTNALCHIYLDFIHHLFTYNILYG